MHTLVVLCTRWLHWSKCSSYKNSLFHRFCKLYKVNTMILHKASLLCTVNMHVCMSNLGIFLRRWVSILTPLPALIRQQSLKSIYVWTCVSSWWSVLSASQFEMWASVPSSGSSLFPNNISEDISDRRRRPWNLIRPCCFTRSIQLKFFKVKGYNSALAVGYRTVFSVHLCRSYGSIQWFAYLLIY